MTGCGCNASPIYSNKCITLSGITGKYRQRIPKFKRKKGKGIGNPIIEAKTA
jgi:hypothetical protein